MTFPHIRKNPSKIGSLVSDLLRIKVRSNLIVLNAGHLRAECIYPAGTVYRMIDLFKLFPMFDFIKVFQATGSDLRVLFEQGMQFLPHASGSFPSISGAEIEVDPSQPVMERVRPASIRVNSKPLLDDKVYTVGALSFLSAGKDGFTKFKELKNIKTEREVYPANAFRELVALARDAKFRQEFALFKSLASHYGIDQLNEFHSQSTKKLYSELTAEAINKEKGSVKKVLKKVDEACLERLQCYTLVQGVTEIEETFVFELDPQEPEAMKISAPKVLP